VYFTPVNGNRGGYIIVNTDDQSETIKYTEPLFLWFDAKVEIIPVMTLNGVRKGSRFIQEAAEKYSG
jgi:hypothetical protein